MKDTDPECTSSVDTVQVYSISSETTSIVLDVVWTLVLKAVGVN